MLFPRMLHAGHLNVKFQVNLMAWLRGQTMLQEYGGEGDIPSDTDEYVEQSPDGRWYRRDQPVTIYNL